MGDAAPWFMADYALQYIASPVNGEAGDDAYACGVLAPQAGVCCGRNG
jgi:hypothetical protein